MTTQEVMAELGELGTAQNRKVYARHGVKAQLFGVSYADLGKLRKRIRVDHALAHDLWATGNHDARVLATMIADPARATARQLEAWAKDLDNYVLTDAFSKYAAASPLASEKMERWIGGRGEWIASAGWNVVALLCTGKQSLPDENLEALLATIEAGIHAAKNRVRHAMNGALIAIGSKNARLRRLALAAAGRIGRVEVDHGETGCKTPDAAAYIRKAAGRKRGSRA